MRLLLLSLFFAFSTIVVSAQEDVGWMAPEGKILNYRTLNWEDFQGEEDKKFADKLAERNVKASAYVCPAIYYTAEHGVTGANGRVTFQFKVKCAFQSRAFVRESTKKNKSNYVLIHEQDHYDISLNFANKLQHDLSSRDYSKDKYNEETHKIYTDLMDRYNKLQDKYDGEVNPDGRDEVDMQHLWDMRIKLCFENNTDEYYNSPLSVVQRVKAPGQVVKRIPGEPVRQFVNRARPIYSEFPEELASKIMETKEWTLEPSIIAFYSQRHYIEEDGSAPKDETRTFGYVFVPLGNDTYKRILIDTLANSNKPVKIAAVFFANADSDAVKELVISVTSTEKSTQASGTQYTNRVYDNVARPLPGKMKRLDIATAKIEGGLDGEIGGKPSKAKCKTEQEIMAALKAGGY